MVQWAGGSEEAKPPMMNGNNGQQQKKQMPKCSILFPNYTFDRKTSGKEPCGNTMPLIIEFLEKSIGM